MIGYYNYTVILTYLGLTSSIIGIYYSMEYHPFIGILCFVGGVVFDTTYIKAVFFTLTIMIFLYIIRDCLFRHND